DWPWPGNEPGLETEDRRGVHLSPGRWHAPRACAKYVQGISMKISAVKTAVVEANYDYTYVRVYADSEEYGTGECFFAPGLTTIIRELAPVLVGKDPRHVDRLTRELRRAASGAGAVAGYAHDAISGMETAWGDLVGKQFQ